MKYEISEYQHYILWARDDVLGATFMCSTMRSLIESRLSSRSTAHSFINTNVCHETSEILREVILNSHNINPDLCGKEKKYDCWYTNKNSAPSYCFPYYSCPTF